MYSLLENNFLDFDWDKFASTSQQNIVIDAGHLEVGVRDNRISFGKDLLGPSETQTLTFYLGLKLASHLLRLGKNCTINLCLSDTTKNFECVEQRAMLKNMADSLSLPHDYAAVAKEFPQVPIELCFQTVLSNKSTSRIKQIKKELKKSVDLEKVYQNYKALFLTDQESDLFGFLTPFLLNTSLENSQMKGDWWLDENCILHPLDLVRCPFLSVKKLGIIHVYSKSAGILCPGTYAGQMLALPPHADRVAIYARDDDETIAEKILRGIIASFIFSPSSTYQVQVATLTKGATDIEQAHINKESIFPTHIEPLDELIQKADQREIFEKYSTYQQQVELKRGIQC